jgi:hypothetical protein
METLAAIARQRAIMTAIADVIVATAAGRRLRIAVRHACPDQTGFADHLTQALHARGRPCRCLPARPGPDSHDGSPAADDEAGGAAVTVITGGAPGPDETEVSRIDIQLGPLTQVAASAPSSGGGHNRQDLYAADGDEPDIIVDYLDPDRPTIRHIRATLTSPPRRR